MNILDAIAADPTVDPALRNLLTRRAVIQNARRFDAAPITGFGELPAHQVKYSEAWWEQREEIMDSELADQRADERAEREERGE